MFSARHHRPGLRGQAVPCSRAAGAGWNRPCLAQGSPNLPSQRPPGRQCML